MVQLVFFAAGSAAVVLLSWRSLRVPGSHGFYRFFAFEFLLALIVINAPVWFQKPFSPRQIASWILLTFSAGLATEAFRLLRQIGRPSAGAARDANLPFENTTRLVTTGLYRLIRHPMYASLLAFAWGACLKDPSVVCLALAVGVSGFLTATALVEERENRGRFREEYASYMKATWRFIPFVF
jgi:protein-S-isoprenylcysteine O-methyltransferase Ste14